MANPIYHRITTSYFRSHTLQYNNKPITVIIERRFLNLDNRRYYVLSLRISGDSVNTLFVDSDSGCGGCSSNPHEIPRELFPSLLEMMRDAEGYLNPGAMLPGEGTTWKKEPSPVAVVDQGNPG